MEHLGALLLVNAKESGTPDSLELQLRASAPRAPEKGALISNQQSLATDPPTPRGPWMGKEAGRGIWARQDWGRVTVCRSLAEQAPAGGIWPGTEGPTSSQVNGVAAHAQLIYLSTGIQELLLQQSLFNLQLRRRLWGVVGGWGQGLVGS